jgi:hypothetical protein
VTLVKKTFKFVRGFVNLRNDCPNLVVPLNIPSSYYSHAKWIIGGAKIVGGNEQSANNCGGLK